MKNHEYQIRGIIKRERTNSGVAGLKVKISTKGAPLIEGIAIGTGTDADGKFACSFELCLMQHGRGSRIANALYKNPSLPFFEPFYPSFGFCPPLKFYLSAN